MRDGHLSAAAAGDAQRARARSPPSSARSSRALRRAVPGLVVTARLRYSLDALVVLAPSSSLRRLSHVRGVQHVFRSASFRVETDRVPTVIDAVPLWNPTPFFPAGSRGQGMRIGIIDDGIDITRPSFSGEGYSYPSGLPEGPQKGRQRQGDRRPRLRAARTAARASAPPSTRTAPITAPTSPASRRASQASPQRSTACKIPNLSGVAPDAYLGNYRVLTTPTPDLRARRQRRRDRAGDRPRGRRRHGRAQPLARRAGGGAGRRPRRARDRRRGARRRDDRRRGGQRGRRGRLRHHLLARQRGRRDHRRRGHERSHLRAAR